MDPLGKKGEKAFEGVQNVSERLEELESHLHAVDNALQDFMDDSEQILEHEYEMERQEIAQLEETRKKNLDEEREIEDLEKRVEELEKKQHRIEKQFEQLRDSELVGTISKMMNMMKKLNRSSTNLRGELESLKKQVKDLDNNLMLEINRRDYDFEQKLDKSEFKSEKVKTMEEIRKLRASVNVLADELDKKDEIEVE